MASEAFADTLYAAFKDRIEAASLISSQPSVAVIRKDSGSPEDLVLQATAAAGHAGVCVFLSRPRLVLSASQSPQFAGTFVVEIAEDPTLNRGAGGVGKTAAQIEEVLVEHFIGWVHGLKIGPLFVRDADVPEEGGGNLRQITFGFGAILNS